MPVCSVVGLCAERLEFARQPIDLIVNRCLQIGIANRSGDGQITAEHRSQIGELLQFQAFISGRQFLIGIRKNGLIGLGLPQFALKRGPGEIVLPAVGCCAGTGKSLVERRRRSFDLRQGRLGVGIGQRSKPCLRMGRRGRGLLAKARGLDRQNGQNGHAQRIPIRTQHLIAPSDGWERLPSINFCQGRSRRCECRYGFETFETRDPSSPRLPDRRFLFFRKSQQKSLLFSNLAVRPCVHKPKSYRFAPKRWESRMILTHLPAIASVVLLATASLLLGRLPAPTRRQKSPGNRLSARYGRGESAAKDARGFL